jgi:precorrin-6A/cobalt-precorrin-6A reductase
VTSTRRVLVLGGTAEGRALASACAVLPGLEVISSLAGRTSAPLLPAGEVRIGGFGGVEGLVRYLGDGAIDAVVDATHPFAATMTAHAAEAAARSGVPLVVLRRPGWTEQAGDDWRRVPSLAAAAALLSRPLSASFSAPLSGPVPGSSSGPVPGSLSGPVPGSSSGPVPGSPSGPVSESLSVPLSGPVSGLLSGPSSASRAALGERVFLTTGRQSIAAFAGVDACWFLSRSVEPPTPPMPARLEVLLDRGPFTVDSERALLAAHRIDVLVTKDSGGATGKLDAARAAGIPVVMVDRPPLPPAVESVATVEGALSWLTDLFPLERRRTRFAG